MEMLGIDLGGWLDNANNFYLQLLSECALFGLSLIFLGLTLLGLIMGSRYMDEDPKPKEVELAGSRTLQAIDLKRLYPSVAMQSGARVALFVFAVLLLTGPHLLNPEVQIIFAATLCAACLRPVLVRKAILEQLRVGTLGALFAFSFGFMILAGMHFSPRKSRGFYPPDASTKPLVRWSGSAGRIVVCNNTDDTVQFRFRSLKPDLEKHPVKVLIHRRREGAQWRYDANIRADKQRVGDGNRAAPVRCRQEVPRAMARSMSAGVESKTEHRDDPVAGFSGVPRECDMMLRCMSRYDFHHVD